VSANLRRNTRIGGNGVPSFRACKRTLAMLRLNAAAARMIDTSCATNALRRKSSRISPDVRPRGIEPLVGADGGGGGGVGAGVDSASSFLNIVPPGSKKPRCCPGKFFVSNATMAAFLVDKAEHHRPVYFAVDRPVPLFCIGFGYFFATVGSRNIGASRSFWRSMTHRLCRDCCNRHACAHPPYG
jgi:hypothetical protein